MGSHLNYSCPCVYKLWVPQKVIYQWQLVDHRYALVTEKYPAHKYNMFCYYRTFVDSGKYEIHCTCQEQPPLSRFRETFSATTILGKVLKT